MIFYNMFRTFRVLSTRRDCLSPHKKNRWLQTDGILLKFSPGVTLIHLTPKEYRRRFANFHLCVVQHSALFHPKL